MAAVNAHTVLHDAPRQNDFLKNITLSERLIGNFRETRDLIREHLKAGIRDWEGRIARDQLFEAGALRKMTEMPALQPKFRMQGSFVYKTVNDPAAKPPQEVDLDDGLFLPVAFFESNGATHPLVASKGFFALVETILRPLCDEHGWILDTSKDSCVRVRLTQGAHIDIPLYAVADEAFARLVEKRAKSVLTKQAHAQLKESIVLDDDIYKELGETEIRLAHREEGWMVSDPRKIEDWFRQAIEIHGEQLRRVCRYLKAWRDYNWLECKLSSLTLMQCVVMALDELRSRISQSRDDIALLEVVKKLPDFFQGDIENPVIEGLILNDNWTDEMRLNFVERARALRSRISNALAEDTPKADVLKNLRSVLGHRIPNDESLVSHEPRVAVISAYEPARVPQPNVKRSTSG